uniref:Immunoglobulin V-set domain-containing protein n=1 Tax=Oryzias latipes TaxID=8090 RepID=A0A3P9J2N3_ORYLA
MCHSLLSSLILFILTVFWAQKVEVLSQVTGYVGFDVTLPCRFIQGKESSNVTQSQWDFLSPDGNKTCIIVFNKQHGKGVHESHLKGRVDMDDQSLQIKNEPEADASGPSTQMLDGPAGQPKIQSCVGLTVSVKGQDRHLCVGKAVETWKTLENATLIISLRKLNHIFLMFLFILMSYILDYEVFINSGKSRGFYLAGFLDFHLNF